MKNFGFGRFIELYLHQLKCQMEQHSDSDQHQRCRNILIGDLCLYLYLQTSLKKTCIASPNSGVPPCSRRYPGWEKKTLEGYPSGSLCKPCLVQKLEKININRIYKVCSHHLLYKLNNQPMVLIIHNIHIYHMAILGFCW